MAFRLDLRRITSCNLFKNQNKLIRNFATEKSSDGRASSTKGSSVNTPSKEIVTPFPPLTEPLKDLPPIQYATVRPEQEETHVTTLSNGLRVASENRFGQFCTVGVVIDSGPRYEVAYPSGIAHFLEKLAFNSTLEYPEKDIILRELERHGGICDCQSSRDTFIYAASADSRGLDQVTKVLAEVVLRPQLKPEEVDMARQAVLFELESLHMRPEQEPILMDMIHGAAYRDNTLGLPKLCPSGNASKIDRNMLLTYLKHHHTPKRMVVAGVGVHHDEFVKLVEKHFVESQATWDMEPLKNRGANLVDSSIAQYTGGTKTEECDIPIYASVGLPELAHVVIGLEGCSHQDDDFISACVLNIMMGGGGSFSAGGPGKGMYTRLYTNVLNRYHWMYSATAYNHAYMDTGLFCIHASAPPTHVRGMVEVITKELVTMATAPAAQELRRAKTQLQSMLLMNLESRPVVFEDIGRQVLATGQRKKTQHFIDSIEKIQPEDIQRVARRFLSSAPALAARGQIQGLPSIKDIQAGLLQNGVLPGKRLSLFH
ncbi:CLUMA_CG001072, isoform A [Clunio marinus]|uniref:Mitochondrial-processing peptidase subunit alpha n=1 Tax=Clunio marinus TaxID=568069 RepID=A0A1J1HLE4_9DIPT|nr:CLUMA_CG001072, isoform A [Clunio marinus]